MAASSGSTAARPRAADVLISDGVIVAVEDRIAARGTDMLDASGAWLIPGLWDAHMHFGQWVRAASMIDLTGTAGPEEVCARVRRELAGRPDDGRLVFGFGYRSAGWDRSAPSPSWTRQRRAGPWR